MKKTFFLLTVMTMFVSCADVENVADVSGGGETGTTSQELTLSTMANQTRAIAEGTQVPTGNVIGLFTNFYSDVNSREYSNYNGIRNFGYDYNKKVWRGANSVQSLSQALQNLSNANTNYGCLLDELLANFYASTPFYWPAGENINMDYTAYSCSNLVSLAGQMLNLYFSDELAGLGGDISGMLEDYVTLNPTEVNPNRMDIGYNFSAFNYLPYAMEYAFDGAYIEPEAIAVILALCALTNTPTGFPNVDIHLRDLHSLIMEYLPNGQLDEGKIETLISDKEGLNNLLEEKVKEFNLEEVLTFVQDYNKACRQLKRDKYITDGYEKEEKDPLPQERVEEVMSKAYWIFMTRVPLISKYLQDDLMYAYDRNLRNDAKGTIKATFNHAKAWVKVVVNNQTNKDIFVSGIAFNDVKTSGTLIVDNSKSGFEAYWDFTKPIHQQQPDLHDTNVDYFESYEAINLDGESQSGSNDKPNEAKPSNAKDSKGKQRKKESVLGFIPDMYYVPAGCYGPANNIAPIAFRPSNDASSPKHGLRFDFLSGDQQFDASVANNLGGAMFPAQEPGKIAIKYYAWDGTNQPEATPYSPIVTQTLEMGSTAQEWDKYFVENNLHEVELNLPRLRWQMGKVYIYVINISDSEITINPTVTEWENSEYNPIIVPEESGMRSGDPTETFGNGDTSGWGF